MWVEPCITLLLQLHSLVGLIAAVRRLLGPSVPVVVGGRPFSIVPDLHELVGADATANDGASAVLAVNRLLGRGSGGVV